MNYGTWKPGDLHDDLEEILNTPGTDMRDLLWEVCNSIDLGKDVLEGLDKYREIPEIERARLVLARLWIATQRG